MRLSRRLGRAGAVLSTLIIGFSFALLSLAEPLPVKALRNVVFDGFQRSAPRPFNAELPVVIVDIDDRSLERFGQWPWPRTLTARLLEAIDQHQPAVTAFDMVFSEPDRLSPERVLEALPPSPEREALAARIKSGGAGSDAAFAGMIAKVPTVLGVVLAETDRRAPVSAGFARAGDDPLPFVPQFKGAIGPIEPLSGAAKGHGALNWVPEYDQVIRRVPTLAAQGDALVPSLAIEALRVAQGASTIIVKASNASGENAFGRQTGIVSLKVGDVIIPTDADGAIRIRYAGANSARRVPAWQVLEGGVEADRITGRIVLVGSSASALADIRATPLDASLPGVEVQAEIIEHVLSGAHLARPDWMPGAEALLTFGAALFAAFVGYRFPPLAATAIGIVSAGTMAFVSWKAFSAHNLLLDGAVPSLAGLSAFLATSIVRWRRSDAERRAVREAFARYLSPAMVERLAANPEQLRLGGEQRTLTVLFSDVRGFTSLAETYRGDPQSLTMLMNRLLTPLSTAITQRSGTIDKYMGDAILAFWNAPLDVKNHAVLACSAALDMQDRLAALNIALSREAEAQGRRHVPIAIGIGINTGDCIVGNMGSDLRFDYSVLGDPANVASRLEGQTRYYRLPLLAGETTAQETSARFAMIEVDLIRLPGRREPQRIFALLGDKDVRASDGFARLKAAMASLMLTYRSGEWQAAETALAAMRGMDGAPDVSGYLDMMAERIAAFRKSPPPADWGGVHTADKK